ncbi:BTAD domain-containing putative transcriptional regulator [Pseudonocardia kunmingensis]|uniref:BTAD domain-containing putative transcriptional regulator n=1 Tax=Pseudonocardia kunmingensis TaxID=630975 RepID=UPI001154CA3B|nr:BTAD domain-containing putative transcriptional regulator [Pseudonocardia kunmingensis]
MRFGLLGPLAVWAADGTPVRIPESKVRALLADLLLHEGQVVPTDRLVEDLWPARVPSNPAGAVQTRVAQLRRALEDAEPGGRELVVSRRPGYLLRTGPDSVDAHRFRALTAQADTAPDAKDRAVLLADALALWRGPALADLADETFARPAANRWEELRLTALEAQAEVRLELGEHHLLVGELTDLVARHPLRERLRAAHMRALYRAGRQAEALAGYRELRDRLADELGIDPGPAITALHQAVLEQDPRLAAPARTTPVPRQRGNLPAPLTELIGRDEEVAHARSLLERGRLVTLVGPGGVGKTRLAVAAAALPDGVADGVWFVDLAGRGRTPTEAAVGCTADDVAELVLAVLGVRDDARPADGGPADRLAAALRAAAPVIVLDNCEHLVEPVAELAGRLLPAAPGVRILATSREPIGLAGELLLPVEPLELPAAAAGADPVAVRASPAVRLFAARAAAAVPGFVVDADNADAVVAICRRLDGLPLALELAAARVRVLDPRELAARMDDRFRLLTTGNRGGPARQQTLRAMIDWSWELLTAAERTVLRRLAVHVDGCTLDAAEAVCSGDGVRRDEVVALLARLVDRSLVVRTEGPDGARYRLLDSVAAYCVDRLRDAREQDRVRAAHRRYYTGLAADAESLLRGPLQRQWLRRLDAETPNLRAALADATREAGPGGAALRLVVALAWYWVLRGRLREAERSLAAALRVGAGEPDDTSAAATWLAGVTVRLGDSTAAAARAAAIRSSPPTADPGRARAELFLGAALIGFGDVAASEALVDRALRTFRAGGDEWGVAAALGIRARQALTRGAITDITADAERSTALFRGLGDRWGQLQDTFTLASHAEITGDHARAARHHREGMRIAEELGLWTEVADKLSGLGRIALLSGDHDQADELHERARRLSAELGYTVGEEFAELGLGLGARRRGDLDRAESHLLAWLDWDRRMGATGAVALILAELGFVAELRGDAPSAQRLHRESLTAARASGDPRAVALAVEGLAGAHAAAGRHAEAAGLLGRAAALRESVGAPLPPAERGDVDRIEEAARAALGARAWDEEFAAGHRAPPDDLGTIDDGPATP